MESREKYLRAIHELTEGGESSTTTSEVAERLKVSGASVSEAVERLEDANLVCRAPYKGFTLSPMGKKRSREIEEKYIVLKRYFSKVLKLDKPEDEAGRVVYHLSDDAVEKIKKQL